MFDTRALAEGFILAVFAAPDLAQVPARTAFRSTCKTGCASAVALIVPWTPFFLAPASYQPPRGGRRRVAV